MAALANFVGWRHKSRDSTPCLWNTWSFGLFCCYFRHGRHVNSLCQITLIVFQDKHWTTQAFVGPVHFWSHTSLVTSVVCSSASARRTASRGALINFTNRAAPDQDMQYDGLPFCYRLPVIPDCNNGHVQIQWRKTPLKKRDEMVISFMPDVPHTGHWQTV